MLDLPQKTDLPRRRGAQVSGTASGGDAVSGLLLGMRLMGVIWRRIEVAAPFGIGFDTVPGRAQLHVVTQGRMYLRAPDGSLHPIAEGDAVLLPRGSRHALVSDPDAPVQPVDDWPCAHLCPSIDAIDACAEALCSTARTRIFSGCMEFDLGGMHPLVGAMPEVLQASDLAGAQPEILPILEAMEREAGARRAGHVGILARLAEVVATSIVRTWVEGGCGAAQGWVEALRDPALGRVLLAMHDDPARAWTVAELAGQMGASRSVFAERFQAVTGLSPMSYLTDLRMRLAAQWIAREGMTIERAAARAGYGSHAAFTRAFRRVHGEPPAAMRARSRAGTSEG